MPATDHIIVLADRRYREFLMRYLASSAGIPAMQRLADLVRPFELLGSLERDLGGARILADCNDRMAWRNRGGLRVRAWTSLWHRLFLPRGSVTTGVGNHRGTILRLLIGSAIKNRDRIA